MFLGLKEDTSVKKAITIVGFLALVALVPAVHADNCTGVAPLSPSYVGVTTFTPGGASAANNLTTYCGQNGDYNSDPTTARTNFITNSGQSYLDTINWEVNQNDGGTYCSGSSAYYCFSPEYYDGQQGQNLPPYLSPPYGGGVNGTGYSWGTVGTEGGAQNVQDIGLRSNFGTM